MNDIVFVKKMTVAHKNTLFNTNYTIKSMTKRIDK